MKFADDMGASEGAVDQGGPTREFLRLALKAMYDTSGMFGGEDKNIGLVPNSQGKICYCTLNYQTRYEKATKVLIDKFKSSFK